MSVNPARLYVGRLPATVRDRDLEEKFGRYGHIQQIEMKYGFAYVEFVHSRDAEEALRNLNGKEIDGLFSFPSIAITTTVFLVTPHNFCVSKITAL